MLSFMTDCKWTERAVKFMRRAIAIKGDWHVSSESVYSTLAKDLARLGALECVHCYNRPRVRYSVYRVTEFGQKEFSK